MQERNKEVNLSLIHEQHLQLYLFVEQLESVIAAGDGESDPGGTLQALDEYTKVHFGDEEELMRLHGYHSLRAHRTHHNALAMKLVVAREEYEAGKKEALVSLAQYLHSWLTDHIEGWDRQFHQFLNARGLH